MTPRRRVRKREKRAIGSAPRGAPPLFLESGSQKRYFRRKKVFHREAPLKVEVQERKCVMEKTLLAFSFSFFSAVSPLLAREAASLPPGDFKAAVLTPAKEDAILESGTTRSLNIPGVDGLSIFLQNQFIITVPEGSESLWIEFAAENEERDFDFVVRYGQPVELSEGDHGSLIADYGSMSNKGYEELGLWGSDFKEGDYYIAIITADPDGGVALLTATVDKGLVRVESGSETEIKIPSDAVSGPEGDPPRRYVVGDGQQFRLTVPAGSREIYVGFKSDNLSRDTFLALRGLEPSLFSPEGFLFDSVVDLAGGFEEACIPAAEIPPDDDYYVWVLSDAGENLVVTGTLTVSLMCSRTVSQS